MLARVLFSIALVASLSACRKDKDQDAEATQPPLIDTKATVDTTLPIGTFVVVDQRRASDVAAPASPVDAGALGERLIFGPGENLSATGMGCDQWRFEPVESAGYAALVDPILADLQLLPSDASSSSGDQRVNLLFEISCEGEFFNTVLKVDDQILVMPADNSALWLILERPLSPTQTKIYQTRLRTRVGFEGELSGVWDEETEAAHRAWYQIRSGNDDQFAVPRRPALTENLLDTLGVLTGQ